MGCTPSTIQHDSHQYSADGAMKTRDQHSNVTTNTGSTSSPRSWRFRKGAADKEKAIQAVQAVPRPALPQRTSQDLRFGNIAKANQAPLKMLLAFHRDDFQSDALWLAAEKLGYECHLARSRETTMEAFLAKNHDIVIVDNRQPKSLDGEDIVRSLRHLKYSQFTIIIALVKRSYAEKDETNILPLLNAGYNRWLTETSSLGMCMSELLQIESNDIIPRQQLAASQAFLLAVDRGRDLVQITDSNQKIVYVNRASERILGYSYRDILGHPVLEITRVENRDLMMQQLQKGREWEGSAACVRKTGDTIFLNCRVVPNNMAPGRPPTHYVFIQEVQSIVGAKRGSDTGPSVSKDLFFPQRSSLQSIKRGSLDLRSICSDGTRRQSMTKLGNLSIEAPITRIIKLITTAQENSSPEVAHMLEKATEILHTSELYSPSFKDDKVRTEDPVASNLISALLQQGATMSVPSTRRSSNDSVASSTRMYNASNRVISRTTTGHSAQLQNLLDTSLLWEFDVFRLEELTNKRPLVHLGMNLMLHFNVPQTLGCDEVTLYNWLTIIEVNYKVTNSYHNSTHASDVMQACAGFMERDRLKRILDPLDDATCLIAAAAHDVDHPGKSSAFLCNSDDDLAIMYNDICVLESHHSAFAFKLTMSDERVNIFKGLEREVYRTTRQSVIDMILATEMTKHFEHLAKFVNVFSRPTSREDIPAALELGSDLQENSFIITGDNVNLLKRMLIKCADVSNPARPLKCCVEWARRIAEEYFNQTDIEKSNNLPVVMPMFDRNTCSIPNSQIGFMDFIINDMFEAWEAFIEMPELMQYMQNNYIFWKEKAQQGLRTVGEKDITEADKLTAMPSQS